MLMNSREKFVVSGQGDWRMRCSTRRTQKERKKCKRKVKQLWRRFAKIQLKQGCYDDVRPTRNHLYTSYDVI